MADIPTKRSEWAKLDWQSAQHMVGRMLNHAGFTMLEELNLGKKRADIMVTKTESNTSTIGIIEVKCYQKIGKTMQEKALIQACRYMTRLYNLHTSNQR